MIRPISWKECGVFTSTIQFVFPIITRLQDNCSDTTVLTWFKSKVWNNIILKSELLFGIGSPIFGKNVKTLTAIWYEVIESLNHSTPSVITLLRKLEMVLSLSVNLTKLQQFLNISKIYHSVNIYAKDLRLGRYILDNVLHVMLCFKCT